MNRIEIPRLITKQSPKDVLSGQFQDVEWPFDGDWGYDENSLVILNLEYEEDGIDFENIFAEARCYEELYYRGIDDIHYDGIEIEKEGQELLFIDNRKVDKVNYLVSFWEESKWVELVDEWKLNNGYEDNLKEKDIFIKKMESSKITSEIVVYFDITNFFGKFRNNLD